MRPAITEDTAFYWEGAARELLLLQRCGGCGALRHPPSPACARCRKLTWAPHPAQGRGTIHSFVILRPPLVPGVQDGAVVAVVELAEGARVVTNIVHAHAGEVAVGAAVELCFEDVGEGMKLPQFRLATRETNL
jgi:uncharacterized OB-fold protein